MTEAEALEIARKAAVDFIEVEFKLFCEIDPDEEWAATSTHCYRERIFKAGQSLALMRQT